MSSKSDQEIEHRSLLMLDMLNTELMRLQLDAKDAGMSTGEYVARKLGVTVVEVHSASTDTVLAALGLSSV